MKSYREPDFQDRIAAAARARGAALEQLRVKPPVDEAVVAARAAAQQARESAKLEKRQAARLAVEEAKAAKRALAEAQAEEAAAALAASQKPEMTEAERKAARDARYMARKNRKN
ncbi:hypothetical protein BH10PSE13_BH10PSE13_12960 [soil metagenome]